MGYKCLKQQTFQKEGFSIEPIRSKDKLDIMRWRNEQLYHLRQQKLLTEEEQEIYFANVVSKLFTQDHPGQILFSYLKGDTCLGYGGLVHINWKDMHAEISFVMDTSLEKDSFQLHWKTFLALLEEAAFKELHFHKIFTYAFNLRSHLYTAIESAGYTKEATLKEHCFFEGRFIDVVIHSKLKPL